MVKLSIILPVYNVSKYIRQCIDSILNQPFKDFELIIVDDGSTDNSGKICDEYVYKDLRVKVHHKLNGGLSSARNYGISKHRGKYLSFIDSDDFIVGDYYTKAIARLDDDESLDMVWLQYVKMFEDGRIEKKSNKETLLYSKNKDNRLLVFLCSQEAFAWLKIYRSSIFKNIRYPEGQILEDLFIVPDIYAQINKLIVIRMDGYYVYRQRSLSICHTKHTPKMLMDIALSYARIIQLYKDNDREGYIKSLATYSSGYLNAITLFPDYDYSRLKTLYGSFNYEWSEIFVTYLPISQKIKLFILKLFGYKYLRHLYRIIYYLKH